MTDGLRWGMIVFLAAAPGCGEDGRAPGEAREGVCEVSAAEAPDFLRRIGCRRDMDAMASAPVDASIPGARSTKVVLDRTDGALYFQNSGKYKIHWEFASAHLSGGGKPIVLPLSRFNDTEYYRPDRRFILAAVTYYEGPKVWALEMAPYDTASVPMVTTLFDAVVKAAYFGPALVYHPTSESLEREAAKLPKGVPIKTTGDLFAAIEYQPLNLATAVGKLRFLTAQSLGVECVAFRDVVVLDHVPNDISVVSGIITEQFQTPLSHINVLSQNRHTPNMGLRNAHGHAGLRALDGKWVRLTVGPFAFTIEEVSQATADDWWEANKPAPLGVPRLDAVTREMPETERLVDVSKALREAVKAAIPAYGGKAAHYAALAQIRGVPVPRAFAIPVFYYRQFMQQNGFDARVEAMIANPAFAGDCRVRDRELEALRDAMEIAPVDPAFERLVLERAAAVLPPAEPGQGIRFRSSTNTEDLEGFTGAGLYTSKTGMPGDPSGKSVLNAVRKVWASVWRLRAFDEREYRSIDHRAVGMALLVHRNTPDEESNGVALTANPFDTSGLVPGFYVNVQKGESSVVLPPARVKTDQLIYQFGFPNQPTIYLEHSTLVPSGETVLTKRQLYHLGTALDAIHRFFMSAYGPAPGQAGWYAMDVEFKFDGLPGQEPKLIVKQARPHPGRGR